MVDETATVYQFSHKDISTICEGINSFFHTRVGLPALSVSMQGRDLLGILSNRLARDFPNDITNVFRGAEAQALINGGRNSDLQLVTFQSGAAVAQPLRRKRGRPRSSNTNMQPLAEFDFNGGQEIHPNATAGAGMNTSHFVESVMHEDFVFSESDAFQSQRRMESQLGSTVQRSAWRLRWTPEMVSEVVYRCLQLRLKCFIMM